MFFSCDDYYRDASVQHTVLNAFIWIKKTPTIYTETYTGLCCWALHSVCFLTVFTTIMVLWFTSYLVKRFIM